MDKEYQIFIILSNPKTIIAKMIGLYTRAPYNHASIAFDAELQEVYSFGRKHPLIPIIGGFVKEDIGSGFFEQASCAIYSCSVSKEQYHRMRNYVKQFEDKCEAYSYNFLGILGVILNKELGRHNAYFCSEFVCNVFQHVGMRLTEKSSALTTPHDLSHCSLLKLTYRGNLETYRNIRRFRSKNSPGTASAVRSAASTPMEQSSIAISN